jgi:carboxyl-terminal processing protease
MRAPARRVGTVLFALGLAGCAGSWEGGIRASLRRAGRTGSLTVVSVARGGPAERAGLRPGDAIVAVDGVLAAELSADELSERVRGEVGSRVTLRARGPDGATRDVVIERGPQGE